MPEIKNVFTQGKMNKDLDERMTPNGQYRDAMNIQVTTSDSSDVGVVQNILGNEMLPQGSISDSGTPGTFQCVGAVADEKTDSIYYFVRGSTFDAIIELSNNANTPIIVDSSKDVLKFDGSYITGVNIIDGLIYFTDNVNEPKKVNIETLKLATGGSYTHTQVYGRDIEEKDITVIKKKPNIAPYLILSTSSRDGYLGDYDTIGDVYYGIARQRNLDNKVVGDEMNLFMEVGDPTNSISPIFDYKVGDTLLLSASSNNIPTYGNEEVMVTILEVFERVADNSYTTTGFRQRIRVKVKKITNTVATGTNDLNVVFFDSSSTVNNKKFFRFSTRYKYEDNEYSAFGPWSEIAFLPSFYEYAPTKEPYNLGMQNAVKSIILKNFVGPDTPEDVYSIDILYKEENSNTVYVVDNVSRTDVNNLANPLTGSLDYNNFNYTWESSGDFTGKYTITSQNIKSAVPEDQFLRVWDNVPIKALAQEIVANRLVYGNYTENYNVDTKPTLKAFIENRNIFSTDLSNFNVRGQKSIKTSREYQVGVVFSDEYGRETPVFTDESMSLSSDFYYEYPKRLTASLTSFTTPEWAKYYKFYIKETSGEYYNLAMDRAYPADEDRNLWISFPSSDRNKLKEDDYLILKKPRLKEDTTLDNWELGIGNGIQERNKFKVIDIKNEAPEFVKTKYFSLGKAKNGNAGNNTLQDHLFRGTSVMPASGRDLLKIDKHFWYHSSGGWNNQDLIPDDKSIEENVLAIQFSIPGVLSGTTQYSKRYEITSVSTNNSHTAPAATANNIFYTLQLKQPIEQEDAWVQSATNTLDTNLTVEIFKIEKNNTQEFEGRFFVKIMGNEMTREFIETREGGAFVSLASMDVFNLSDTDYQTQTATASSTGSTTNTSNWASLLYNFSGDSSNNGFFVDSMYFAGGQSSANNSIGNSGILTAPDTNVIAEEIVAATPDTKKDELISGIHEGFVTADDSYTHNSSSSSDFSDSGEKGWRTQPQQLFIPTNSANPTSQPASTRYMYQNGKHYIHISFSSCGEDLFNGSESFPITQMGNASAYDDYYQFNAPFAGNSGSQTATDWVTTITRGSGQDLKYRTDNVTNNPANGWAKLPNYENSTASAYKITNILYPTVDPSLSSPNHIYNSSSKRKWRNMWDPTVDTGGNTVQERVDFINALEQEGSKFYFNNDPNQEVYTILSQPKKIRLYNHTSWRTTWVEDNSAPTFDKALVKRHLGGFTNNSVEEALLGLFAHGNSGAVQDYEGNSLNAPSSYANIRDYLKDTMYDFGKRNNRRVVYVVEVDKDPSTISWNPVANIASTTASALTFVEQNLSSDDPGLPKSPAIWETEPKEELDLDIYYEVSNNIPFNIDDDTNELFAPVGSKLYAFTTNSDNDWTHQALYSNTEAIIGEWTGPNEFTTKGLGYLYYDVNSTYMQTIFAPDFNGPINPSEEDLWIDEDLNMSDVDAKNIYLKLYDPNTYNYVTAKVIDVQLSAGNFTVGNTYLQPDIQKVRIQQINNHLLDVGLGWWNCVNFGNGVESDRVRDDFNEVQVNNGVKVSTIVSEKYEQEVKKNTLIYSNIYNPLSNVNGFNQFIFANKITKSLSPNYGSIQKLFTRDNDLISFCEDKVIQIAADKDILFNADGNPQLVASNKVLGQSRPFEGDFGISKDPESFASESYRSYFTDRKRRSVLRLSKDGITRISDHGMSDYFHDNMLTASVLLGSFDFNKQEYNLAGVDGTVVSFSESVKGWTSFKSFTQMEFGISVSGDYYTFFNASPYLHHSESANYNTFYNIHEPSSLTAILNESPSLIKKFKTINYEGTQGLVQAFTGNNDNEYYNLSGNSGWYVDFIRTDNSVINYGINSFLEFKNKENKWFSNIRGNSIEENSTFDISNFNFQGIGEKSN